MPTGARSSDPLSLAPGATTGSAPPPRARRPSRRRRLVIWSLAVLTVVVAVAGGIAYWALDRYVIDHVEIDDVAAYEQAESDERATEAAATSESVDTTTEGADSVAGSTDEGADGGTPETTSSPVLTADSYVSDSMSITIDEVVTGSGDDRVTYFVADVVLDDATQLRGGFAENKFGTNIVEDTSDIAADYDAVFAINGDYYGYRDSGIVIRNGVLYRDEGTRTGLAVYADGSMAVYDEESTSGEQLVADGVRNTLSFGPALVVDSEIVEGIEEVEVDTNFGNHSIQGNQPRTGIGLIDDDHFVFVVVDGRSEGYSRGVTMIEFAEIFKELGATTAYNLDGGGSSTMYFGGDVVNDPLGKGDERGTSDILYLAEASDEARS